LPTARFGARRRPADCAGLADPDPPTYDVDVVAPLADELTTNAVIHARISFVLKLSETAAGLHV